LKVQKIKREIRLREWAEQVKACEASGLSISKWCAENGIIKSSFYYRLRRVQEEFLDTLESSKTCNLPALSGISGTQQPSQTEAPVFAPLTMPQNKGAAVTVLVASQSGVVHYAVEIQNGADDAVVEQVLRVVSRI
jgi:hypothetical protein